MTSIKIAICQIYLCFIIRMEILTLIQFAKIKLQFVTKKFKLASVHVNPNVNLNNKVR